MNLNPYICSFSSNSSTERLVEGLAEYRRSWEGQNKILHIICVLLLFASLLVTFSTFPGMQNRIWAPNWSLLVIAFYAFYYASFDIVVGLEWCVAMGGPLWFCAMCFRLWINRAWLWALGIHIWVWYAQLHLKQESWTRPRSIYRSSVLQKMTFAPLYVFYEILFVLGLASEMRSQIEQKQNNSVSHRFREFFERQN